MMKYVVGVFGVAVLCWAFYLLGRSRAEVRLVKEQVEVIKYVDRKQAEIQARPHAGRAELLRLMHKGEL